MLLHPVYWIVLLISKETKLNVSQAHLETMQVNSSITWDQQGNALTKKRTSPEAGRTKFFRKVNGILIWEFDKGFFCYFNFQLFVAFLKKTTIEKRQSCISQDIFESAIPSVNLIWIMGFHCSKDEVTGAHLVVISSETLESKTQNIPKSRWKKQVSYSYILLISKLAETSLCIP